MQWSESNGQFGLAQKQVNSVKLLLFILSLKGISVQKHKIKRCAEVSPSLWMVAEAEIMETRKKWQPWAIYLGQVLQKITTTQADSDAQRLLTFSQVLC